MSTMSRILPWLPLEIKVPGSDLLRRQVSASLKHQFSSLSPGGKLVRVQGSSGIVQTKLQARIELFLAA